MGRLLTTYGVMNMSALCTNSDVTTKSGAPECHTNEILLNTRTVMMQV